MRCRHSPVGGHIPQLLVILPVAGHPRGTLPRVVPVVSAPSMMRCGHSPVDGHSLWRGGGVKRRLVVLLQGNSPMCPRGSSFGKILRFNPVVPSVPGTACPLTQPTSPARSGTGWVRVTHVPTFNSPQPASSVSLGLPLRPYSPPNDLRQPGLSQCCSSLVWQGRGLLIRLSPRSSAAGPAGAGLGLQPPWSPRWFQGPFFS